MTAVVESTDGFEVVGSAVDGEQSVVLCAELRPDLVLMDLNLPGIDGLEATRRLRALSPHPPVVLLLSTYDVYDGYADAGAGAFLSKSELGPEALEAFWSTVTR
ncbi:MAG: response regulator transcription factor, partial [Streptomyces sp.]|uniref:response regulator n=1 Tax=Streptomyces sp. TaxID=1931 RepID=UPI0025FF473D